MPLLRSRMVRILLLGLTMIAAAACSPATEGLPTAADGAGASTPADPGAVPSGASSDPFVAWPAFAACLRDHGATVADPVLDSEGNPTWTDEIKQFLTEPIRTACTPLLAAVDEGGTLKGGRNRPTFSFESELAHAACMRSHGFPTWPDPDANTGGGSMPEGFDKFDPAVLAALTGCESLLVETTASPSPEL